jgi:subtilisin family serine protease
MRVLSWLAASLVLAASLGGAAAQTVAQQSPTGVPLDVTSLFTPTQINDDGSVYGVRGDDIAAQTSGSLEILPGASRALSTPTPGTCDVATNFPGGWCNTAHNIAASVFGWNFSAGGKGVIIGMIDTGMDLNSPEFDTCNPGTAGCTNPTSRILPGYCVVSAVNTCTGTDAIGGDSEVYSPTGNSTHGTHTAGIAAGLNVGIAYQADILPVKVCGSVVDSCIGMSQGILWASEHGASIISMSIGGPTNPSTTDLANFRQAIANGSLIVVAAGNSGDKDPTSGFASSAAIQPGIAGSMIVVGATGCNGPNSSTPTNCANGGYGSNASFSQPPGTQCNVVGTARYCMMDYYVVAPGVDIWSSVGGSPGNEPAYGYLSGTSMATPYVAGVAAVIKGQWPQLTPAQIASIIFHTADNLGTPGVNAVYGWGAVDITKALSPVGYSVVATSGTLITNGALSTGGGSVANVTGLGGAQAALVSGPLSVAIHNATILQTAVVVDSYGRNFTTNLTQATYNPGFDVSAAMLMGQFMSVTPFAVTTNGPNGRFVASGYEVDTTIPAGLSGQYVDTHQHAVEDLIVDQQLMPGVDLNLGYNLDMSGHFSEYDSQSSMAYNGLFLSAAAVNSPYASLTNGGSYLGSTVQLADDVHMRFGESILDPQRPEYQTPTFAYLSQLEGPQPLYDMRQAQSSLFGVDWDFASWGGLGMVATQTSEQNGLLGGFNSGALSVAKSANTSAVGMSARVGFGDGWVTTFSYNEGITNLSLKSDSLISSADTLHSRAYGFAVAKHGLFDDDDSLGLAVTRPLQVYAGGVNITAADGVDSTTGDLKIGHEYVPLASATPETDLEVGYVTTFMDGALALQANAGYQMNVSGLGGTNAVSVISRAKINF